jgi:thiol-disulfide isomerase/thioredoxin
MTFGSVRQVIQRLFLSVTLVLVVIGFSVENTAFAQEGKLAAAIAIKPKQPLEYEKPGLAVMKACTIATTKNPSGFVVHHSSGRILRRFVDNNNDNKLDQWSYYDNGLEVYRDLDTNFDGRTDAYRWYGTGGTRWGLDKDQNGTIDSWKAISAEEVALECFEAIKGLDQDRFNRILLTPTEFTALQLGPTIAKDLEARLRKARTGFLSMARGQKSISAKAQFVDAGNGRPQMMPAGTLGNKRDVMVYDQASTFFDSDGGKQLALGTLVKVGDGWKMVELPEVVDPKKPLASGGAFFPLPTYGSSVSSTDLDDRKLSQLFDSLTKVESGLKTAKGVAVEKLEKQKADIYVQFWRNTKDPKSKQDWLENLADSVASSYQTDRFEGGIKYLENFIATEKTAKGLDYVKWSTIFAEYGWVNSNGDRRERESGYDRMIDQLKDFQRRYATSPLAADALIQLAVHHEVNDTDEPEQAIEWYNLCRKRFPNTKFGRRAAGAVTRLGSFGKTFPFIGKTDDGKSFDLKSRRGRIVVLHFWETWCCSEDDIEEFAKLARKYKDDIVIVGCNIEGRRPDEEPGNETTRFKDFLKSNPDITWTQLHAPGSVEDSPLAHQLGIATEPLVVLLDTKGNLVESNIGIGSLEREIERERRRSANK